jgi:hypothetical protein
MTVQADAPVLLRGPTPPGMWRWRLRSLLHRMFPGKSNLESFAERELARLGGGEMQAEMNRHILKMVRTFSREGHSGFSASYALGLLQKLLAFEPIQPLTGEADEWMEVGGPSEPCWQNVRCSHVFKDADGRAYDINGKVFVEPDGCAFTGYESRVYVEFPYTPTTEYVQVAREPGQ